MQPVKRFGRKVERVGYSYGLSAVSHVVHARHDLADTVSLIASKRTGSTWVQELISGGPGVCPIFEPLQGDARVNRLSREREALITRDEDVPDLEAFLSRAMRGHHVTKLAMRLATPRQLLEADRFVVKHVQLSLAAGWLERVFPTSPMVLLVRHPCAVTQSMLTVRWSGSTVDEIFERRPAASNRAALELLDGRTTPAEAFAALWCTELIAMLGDTDPARASLLAYESVADDPAGALGPVMEHLGLPRPPDLAVRSAKPSATTHRSSAVRSSGDLVSGWVDRLAAADRDAVLAVVRDAGIAGYGADPRPDLDALHAQHARPPISAGT